MVDTSCGKPDATIAFTSLKLVKQANEISVSVISRYLMYYVNHDQCYNPTEMVTEYVSPI